MGGGMANLRPEAESGGMDCVPEMAARGTAAVLGMDWGARRRVAGLAVAAIDCGAGAMVSFSVVSGSADDPRRMRWRNDINRQGLGIKDKADPCLISPAAMAA